MKRVKGLGISLTINGVHYWEGEYKMFLSGLFIAMWRFNVPIAIARVFILHGASAI